jgi:hypothetical protein
MLSVYIVRSLPTFQRHVLSPVKSYSCLLSAWLTPTLFKILSAYSTETSENFYRIVWHHIAEYRTFHTLPLIRQILPSILLCFRFECKEHTCTITLLHIMFALYIEVVNLDYWSSYQSPPRLNVTSEVKWRPNHHSQFQLPYFQSGETQLYEVETHLASTYIFLVTMFFPTMLKEIVVRTSFYLRREVKKWAGLIRTLVVKVN